jgi:hypothetical protein
MRLLNSNSQIRDLPTMVNIFIDRVGEFNKKCVRTPSSIYSYGINYFKMEWVCPVVSKKVKTVVVLENMVVGSDFIPAHIDIIIWERGREEYCDIIYHSKPFLTTEIRNIIDKFLVALEKCTKSEGITI